MTMSCESMLEFWAQKQGNPEGKEKSHQSGFKLTSTGQYVSDWCGDASFLVTPLHHRQKASNLLLNHRPRKFCELIGTTRLFC